MPFERFVVKYSMQKRPLCKSCNKKPSAINYKQGVKIYYRSRCDSCIRKKKGLAVPKPNWQKSGYRKKLLCEKCGFKSRYHEQFFVFHLDGNLNNTSHMNLRTVCSNCQIEIAKSGLGWVQGDLVPDR